RGSRDQAGPLNIGSRPGRGRKPRDKGCIFLGRLERLHDNKGPTSTVVSAYSAMPGQSLKARLIFRNIDHGNFQQ
ncbi:MAG: hypothetical protein WA199_07065, partial [Xanthobacteraceae bacterium]